MTKHNGTGPEAGKSLKRRESFRSEQWAVEQGLYRQVTKIFALNCLARSRERK